MFMLDIIILVDIINSSKRHIGKKICALKNHFVIKYFLKFIFCEKIYRKKYKIVQFTPKDNFFAVAKKV